MPTHHWLASCLLASVVAVAGCKSGEELLVTCDPACAAGFTCVDGQCIDNGQLPPDMAVMPDPGCQPACVAPTPFCAMNKKCVACLKDDQCPAGQICKTTLDGQSSCVPGCTDDAKCKGAPGLAAPACCGGQCIDTTKDLNNCGACANRCTGQNSTAQCMGGKCVNGACRQGWGDCDGMPENGCEASLSSDPNNCTACGMKCGIKDAINGCANGCYIKACNFGFDDCNLDDMDGCETPVSSDPLNCGGCTKKCDVVSNGRAGCSESVCYVKSCNLGYADCDKMAANGCETNTGTDAMNCGGCAKACQQGYECRGGGCTCAMCNLPHASATCPGGQCLFDKCNPGWGDCDNNQQNGCEKDLYNDTSNCGTCGNVCGMATPYCANGMCDKNPPGVLLGTINNTQFWKVPAVGAMTDTNCFNTCRAVGLNVGCQAQQGCNYNDNTCTITPENSCGNPMLTLSQKICNGQSPSQCMLLWGTYQFMGHKWQNDSTCGAEQNAWCSTGSQQQNKNCMCVR